MIPPARDTRTGLERIATVIVDDHDDLGRRVARRIAEVVRSRHTAGQRTVLGLATGSTPIGVYRELIRMHREEGLSFADVVTFNLDEYYPMAPDSIHSYHRFMWENLFSHVDIQPENVHIPRGDVRATRSTPSARRYEAAIARAGGIDFQILGIGKTGHIGFNEPGSGADSRTRLVHARRGHAPGRRRRLLRRGERAARGDHDGRRDDPRGARDRDPRDRRAQGAHRPARGRRRDRPRVAATFLQRHPNATFYVDQRGRAPSSRASRRRGCSDEVEWTPELIVRAVIWLSQQTGKAILKLTQRDYAEHHLSSLVARYGSPGALNGEVFNALGAKIRGKSKLPREQAHRSASRRTRTTT